jgi:hypothetical protein
MPLDVLSIPAMSSDPERAFSAAKITLTDRRNKLSTEVIECLECLKSWTGKEEWALDREHGEGRCFNWPRGRRAPMIRASTSGRPAALWRRCPGGSLSSTALRAKISSCGSSTFWVRHQNALGQVSPSTQNTSRISLYTQLGI